IGATLVTFKCLFPRSDMRSEDIMKRSLTLVGLLFLGITTHAASKDQAPAKPPWRWTLDERLAARVDPRAAAERVRSARGARISASSGTPSKENEMPADQIDFIGGREHPELFMPWELFDRMMRGAYADNPEVRSDFREASTKSPGGGAVPFAEWNRLDAISLPYAGG